MASRFARWYSHYSRVKGRRGNFRFATPQGALVYKRFLAKARPECVFRYLSKSLAACSSLKET